jgi:predicted lipid-binding transport protein (Tim44 family)
MKKALIGLALATAGFSAHANVLCNIITKDPRYNVTSYVRSQTACVTTTHAVGAGAAALHVVGAIAAIYVVAKIVRAAREAYYAPVSYSEEEYAKMRCLCDNPGPEFYRKLASSSDIDDRSDQVEYVRIQKAELARSIAEYNSTPKIDVKPTPVAVRDDEFACCKMTTRLTTPEESGKLLTY